MPLNALGEYVSIDGVTRQLLGDYMANLVRQNATANPQLSRSEIIQKAGERFAGSGANTRLDNYDVGPMNLILVAEERAVAAANAIRLNGGQVPGLTSIPTIPGDPGHAGAILYDVLVIAENPDTGEQHVDKFNIYTQGAMSGNDIQDLIESMRDHYLRQIRSPAPNMADIPNLDIRTYVLGVGRVAR